jgi:hypothetical protein
MEGQTLDYASREDSIQIEFSTLQLEKAVNEALRPGGLITQIASTANIDVQELVITDKELPQAAMKIYGRIVNKEAVAAVEILSAAESITMATNEIRQARLKTMSTANVASAKWVRGEPKVPPAQVLHQL